MTATVALPDWLESSVEVAVIVAVPAPAGVKTPALLTDPMLTGLTDHVTVELKLPVPLTVGVQADVWLVKIEVGRQVTVTDVIVGVTGGVVPPPPPPQPVMKMIAMSPGTSRTRRQDACTALNMVETLSCSAAGRPWEGLVSITRNQARLPFSLELVLIARESSK